MSQVQNLPDKPSKEIRIMFGIFVLIGQSNASMILILFKRCLSRGIRVMEPDDNLNALLNVLNIPIITLNIVKSFN